MSRRWVWIGIPVLLCACRGEVEERPSVRLGRTVYATNCTACHSTDPRRDGTLGPAVAGSSREVIEARVLGAAYPPGYTPKRETNLMVPLPHLKPYIDDLVLYLDNPE